jgi:hypothetical protein
VAALTSTPGRTSGSTLFVNPLMAIYFTVDLDTLAAHCLYLDRIENTHGMRQVASRIEASLVSYAILSSTGVGRHCRTGP